MAPWERSLGRAPGRVVPVAQIAALGRRWYRGRLAPEWQPRSLEASRGGLAERHGEATVRTFLLYLWSAHHFLAINRTQAYHLVAARGPGGLQAAAELRS